MVQASRELICEQSDEGDVAGAGQQRGDRAQAPLVGHDQLDRRVAVLEVAHEAEQIDRAGAERDGPDAQSAGDHAAQRGHRGQRFLGVAEQAPGVGQENVTRLGELHGATGPLEKRGAYFPLQLGDLMAQAGLGDVAARCRAGEVQLFPHGHGVLELSKIHLFPRLL